MRVRLVVAGFLALGLSWNVSYAQEKDQPAGSTPAVGQLPLEGTEKLKDEGRKHREVLIDLFAGKVEAKSDLQAHTDAIDYEARLSLYRLTWYTEQAEPGRIDRIMKDYENDVRNLVRNKPATNALIPLFVKRMIVRSQEVLHAKNKIAQVNTARELADLAVLGQPELADALAAIVKDPTYNDGVKWYALKGLHDLMALPTETKGILDKEREVKVVDALVQFLHRPLTLTPNATLEELMGFRLLRRQGIRALAQVHSPTVDRNRPALELLKIVANDGLALPASPEERFEAAMGVARMDPSRDKTYQPEYAAYILGLFLVPQATYINSQFRGANADSSKLTAKGRPFKIYASHMIEALDTMQVNSRNPFVNRVVNLSLKVLTPIEVGNSSRPDDLLEFLQKNPPSADRLFRGVEASVVKLPATSETDLLDNYKELKELKEKGGEKTTPGDEDK